MFVDQVERTDVKQSNGGRDDRAFARTRQHGISVFQIFLRATGFCDEATHFSAKTADAAPFL